MQSNVVTKRYKTSCLRLSTLLNSVLRRKRCKLTTSSRATNELFNKFGHRFKSGQRRLERNLFPSLTDSGVMTIITVLAEVEFSQAPD